MVVHRLCIVGLGMMGGAIGLQARRTGTASRVIGVADSKDTIEKARLKGAVDDATLDIREGVHDADLVILVAARIGKARLIDNLRVSAAAGR